MRVRSAALLMLVLIASGCELQVDDGALHAVPVKSFADSKPTILGPVDLPFENPFPNRWNSSNDGTPYEPCVAFSDQDLLRFGIDPLVIEDAAQVDGQGIRGCSWLMKDKFSLSHLVTNAISLAEYRTGQTQLDWKSDASIEGRIVGVAGTKNDETTCMTYVQSYGSGVITSVVISSNPEAIKAYDPCSVALDFTAEYIGRIPN